MTERREQSQSLQSQIRNLAARGSFDGAWGLSRAQQVVVQREASLPDVDSASLRVKFVGEKYAPKPSRPSELLTRYSICATLVYDQLTPELVPTYVRDAVKAREAKEYDADNHLIIRINGEDSEEATTEVLDEYDDSDDLYRFERGVNYYLNGNADLMTQQLSETFLTVGNDEAVATEQVGTLLFRNKDRATEQWSGSFVACPEEILEHPDLRALEYHSQKRELRTDLSFWELIETSERDADLRNAMRKDHARQALALIAFLRYETPAQDILNLVQ